MSAWTSRASLSGASTGTVPPALPKPRGAQVATPSTGIRRPRPAWRTARRGSGGPRPAAPHRLREERTMAIIETEDRGAVRHVVLNRPEKRNAFNGELVLGLGAAMKEAA